MRMASSKPCVDLAEISVIRATLASAMSHSSAWVADPYLLVFASMYIRRAASPVVLVLCHHILGIRREQFAYHLPHSVPNLLIERSRSLCLCWYPILFILAYMCLIWPLPL